MLSALFILYTFCVIASSGARDVPPLDPFMQPTPKVQPPYTLACKTFAQPEKNSSYYTCMDKHYTDCENSDGTKPAQGMAIGCELFTGLRTRPIPASGAQTCSSYQMYDNGDVSCQVARQLAYNCKAMQTTVVCNPNSLVQKS